MWQRSDCLAAERSVSAVNLGMVSESKDAIRLTAEPVVLELKEQYNSISVHQGFTVGV